MQYFMVIIKNPMIYQIFDNPARYSFPRNSRKYNVYQQRSCMV